MTSEQREYYDKLVERREYQRAILYAANIILGPELTSKVVRTPPRFPADWSKP